MSLKRTKTCRSFSSETTKGLGGELARKLAGEIGQRRRKNALVLALRGDLGAGKTTFVQGFLKELGVARHAPSPTFVIMRRYALPRAVRQHEAVAKKNNGVVSLAARARARGPRTGAMRDAFHVDAYRLKSAKHLAALDFEKVLADPANIVLIEWAEQVKRILPKDAVWLTFRHGKRENERSITIKR